MEELARAGAIASAGHRTFECGICRARFDAPSATGRMPKYCLPCGKGKEERRLQKAEKTRKEKNNAVLENAKRQRPPDDEMVVDACPSAAQNLEGRTALMGWITTVTTDTEARGRVQEHRPAPELHGVEKITDGVSREAYFAMSQEAYDVGEMYADSYLSKLLWGPPARRASALDANIRNYLRPVVLEAGAAIRKVCVHPQHTPQHPPHVQPARLGRRC